MVSKISHVISYEQTQKEKKMDRQNFLASLFAMPFIGFLKKKEVINDKKKNIKRIIFWGGGHTGIKYKNGNYESKYPWFSLYLKYIQDIGMKDITDIEFEMPDGRIMKLLSYNSDGSYSSTMWSRQAKYDKDNSIGNMGGETGG